MRTVRNHLWRVLSLAALLGAVLLLMADSAEDCQSPAPYQASFAVTTTCGGDATGTVTVTTSAGHEASVEVTSGELPTITAWLEVPCVSSGQPAPEVTQLNLAVDGHSCPVVLATQLGLPVTCDTGCTVQLDPLP